MTTRLNAYVNFLDTAKPAMEFYYSVFGGELQSNTFGELGGTDDPADRDKIMHSWLHTPNGFDLMAADTPSYMEYRPTQGFSVSLSGDDEEELRKYWDSLSDGATIPQPLEKAPWGDTFGMLTDKYGVTWLVNIQGEPPAGAEA